MSGKILITFDTKTQAMAVEEGCRRRKMPGRLIPVPGKISAGCGVGWMTDREERERLLTFLEEQELSFSAVHDLEGILTR